MTAKCTCLLAALVALLPFPAAGQTVVRADKSKPTSAFSVTPPGWYSGDTHVHIQICDGSVHSMEDVLARMELEDLNVANILIWDWDPLPYTHFICDLTGEPDPISGGERILQYGVETSGLTSSKWGHLIGLNIGPEQARIAQGSLAEGDCDDMDGLGLGGDGSGLLTSTVAGHFFAAPGAVCGYAHSAWTVGIYHPLGYDWATELLDSGFTTDAVYLDPEQKLAVPNVNKILGIGSPGKLAIFLPLMGAMDAVLGNIQFVETVIVAQDIRLVVTPPAHWSALYYKLQSAGVRVSQSGGTDNACLTIGTGLPEDYARTYVMTDEFPAYDAWTRGLAAGRTSIAAGPDTFLRLRVDGAEVGSDIPLASSDPYCTAFVELRTSGAIDDCIELIVDGEVQDSRPVARTGPGVSLVSFDDVYLPESSWVAARLCSQRAQTGAVYVIVDGRPIVDPLAAEYWMLWCDVVTKTVLDHPEISFFGSQHDEALELMARARRAFKTLRDVHGFDLSWNVARYGVSTAACRGPVAIGTTGPATSGESLLVTCVNAPPLADGVLVLSRARDDAGTCDGDVLSFVLTDPDNLIGTIPAVSTRSGYAEVEIPAELIVDPTLYLQFVWTNPPDCAGAACGGGAAAHSASDALELQVQSKMSTTESDRLPSH